MITLTEPPLVLSFMIMKPSPRLAAISSAATSTPKLSPQPMRSPVARSGAEAGMPTWQRRPNPLSPKLREARMQSLRLVDLPRLAAHRRRNAEGASGEQDEPVVADAPARAAGVDLSELE